MHINRSRHIDGRQASQARCHLAQCSPSMPAPHTPPDMPPPSCSCFLQGPWLGAAAMDPADAALLRVAAVPAQSGGHFKVSHICRCLCRAEGAAPGFAQRLCLAVHSRLACGAARCKIKTCRLHCAGFGHPAALLVTLWTPPQPLTLFSRASWPHGRKRKPSLSGSEVPTATFADVAGMESAKRELAEVGSLGGCTMLSSTCGTCLRLIASEFPAATPFLPFFLCSAWRA